jgi:hypothetical protein
MIIVTSASYIDQEFRAEFGALPPAFLPVGNRRLFSQQAESLPAAERRILTLPDTFRVLPRDQKSLAEAGFEILDLPEKLSLGEAVVFALNLAGHAPDQPVRILHGDTLIEDLPVDLDAVTLSEVDGGYSWAVWREDEPDCLGTIDDPRSSGPVRIANGFFAFSDAGLLVRSILKSGGSFVGGINRYSRSRRLRGLPVRSWFDLGHVHTYYRSRARISTSRAFNRLASDGRVIQKSSVDRAKMEAEYSWFRSVPDRLRIYLPQLVRQLDHPTAGYEIQYLYLPPLSDLWVFGRLPDFVWRRILEACFAFMDECAAVPAETPPPALDEHFGGKTRDRLGALDESGLTLSSLLPKCEILIPDIVEAMIADADGVLAGMPRLTKAVVVHGDFCFSNILFDFRSEMIKVIDPRGCAPSAGVSVFGDMRYDLAKLSHSILGMYDDIIAGHFDIDETAAIITFDLSLQPERLAVQEMFVRMVMDRYGIGRRELLAMQVHLFLSMLPLHSDHPGRQAAFLANAIRLHAELRERP